MQLARVIGTLVATQKYEGLEGVKGNPPVDPHTQLPIDVQYMQDRFGGDLPARGEVVLEVFSLGQRGESGLLELVGDVARGMETPADTGG